MTEDKMVGWHHGLDGCEFAVHAGTKSQTWLSDWTEGRKKTRVLIPVLPLIMWWWSESVSHSVVSDYEPMDCSSTGFSVHGILQARILEWVAIPYSRGSSWPRDWTWFTYIAGRFFTIRASREAPVNCATHSKSLNLLDFLLCKMRKLKWMGRGLFSCEIHWLWLFRR